MALAPPLPDSLRVRRKLTGAATGLLLLAGFALFLWLVSKADIQLAIGSAIVSAVVLDGILAHTAVRRAAVELQGPGEIEAGSPSPWSVRIYGWRRPVTVTPLLLPGAEDVLVVDGQPGQLIWPPLRRGTVPFLVVDLKARGPLGLVDAGRRHVVTFRTPVYVTPPLCEIEVRWPRPRAMAFGLVEGAPAGDDLFRSVRPYRFGDERRRVHWKSTAHHGELMVRESDGTGVVRTRIVVDLGPPGPVAELIAGQAVGLVSAALARGWQVELVTLDVGDEVPRLFELGSTFGAYPSLAPPIPVPLPTVCAPVRTPVEASRRMATAAYGTPAAPGSLGRHGHTCHLSPAGLVWS